MTGPLWRLSLEEAAAYVQAREVSPVDLTRSCLDRISAVEPSLNAFVAVTGESALARAHLAEREIASGSYRGPLHGIPVSLKDIFDVAGVPTTAGGSFPVEPAAADSAVAERLASSGAVLIGKTLLHEFAFGVTSVNPHFGAVRNPWAADRIAGGSSGGSAAAVAAGCGFGSIGSDTGGSIRIPAALCGVVGLKPTRGRVSLRGAVPLSWTLDHAGPIARTVRDAALLYGAIAGYDARDPSSRDAPFEDSLAEIESGVAGLRIGVWEHAMAQADPAIADLVRAAIESLEHAGARVSEATLPRADELLATQLTIIGTDAYAFHRERFDQEPERYGEDVRTRIARGRATTGTDYAAARRVRSEIRAAFDAVLGSYDAIALPSTVVAAPLREGADAVATAARLTALTSPFNLTALPAISIPCGSIGGLPVGLQLVGARWHEGRLLRVARAYETVRGAHVWPG